MLANFSNMGYTFLGAATVQMLPDLCSNKIGLSVQIRRITHQAPFPIAYHALGAYAPSGQVMVKDSPEGSIT
jgi:hypothetical protein